VDLKLVSKILWLL